MRATRSLKRKLLAIDYNIEEADNDVNLHEIVLAAQTAATERQLVESAPKRANLRPLAVNADDIDKQCSRLHRLFASRTLPYGGNGSLRPAALRRALAKMQMRDDAVFV